MEKTKKKKKFFKKKKKKKKRKNEIRDGLMEKNRQDGATAKHKD